MTTQKRKNAVTVIVLTMSVLISLTFTIYSQVKGNEAEKNATEALRQTELAMAQKERAEELSRKAQEAAAEATMAMAEANRVMKLLEECQSK